MNQIMASPAQGDDQENLIDKAPRHKPEDQIASNKMLSGRHHSMEQRHGQLQNHCCPDLMPLRSCG